MKTKIIATIGPASDESKVIKDMIEAGMAIARINTKYGTIEEYEGIMEKLRIYDHCKIMFDIKGLDRIKWLKSQKFDFLALSFAESKSQIEKMRKEFDKKIKIISKIESEKGIDNIDEIIAASDGIMVARGDLGKHITLEKVPIFQKLIIKKCNEKKKMVITATEMLLSMVKSPTPERAEVSDVANAVLDGSDYLMLSEETALGEHPVLSVKTMAKIIIETEKDSKLLK